jgi:signal transduction histidine kinase/ActR/RegA family two-component response regulator
VTKDGRRLNVSLTISPIRDHRGHIIGVSKIARDITAAKLAASGLQDERAAVAQDRERLLEAERVARTEAERASRVKDDFVAVVSHELRTPLNAILGWTEVLLRTQKDPQTIRGLEIIRRNTQLQAQLISDLLDISRVVSGKLQLALETLDLVPVIDRAIEMVQHAAEARGIAVVRHFAIKTAIAVGDPHRLQQVVANLLSNAIKFTPPSGRIEVELRRAGTRFEIVVSDNGIGIQPEMLERVFERFHQQDAPTTRRQSGLGLGLAIVRNLVELHGGKVWATSDGADRGATFIVALPVAAGDAVQAQPAARASASASALDSRSLKDLRVLVVEDEVDNRDVIRRLLEAHGASVFTAGTAAEAVLQASDHRPHILVSDIGLPDVDGYELIRRIRALESDGLESIPAVALTAFARSEDRTRALRAGYQAHIAKPVEPAELIATLASFAGLLPGERH